MEKQNSKPTQTEQKLIGRAGNDNGTRGHKKMNDMIGKGHKQHFSFAARSPVIKKKYWLHTECVQSFQGVSRSMSCSPLCLIHNVFVSFVAMDFTHERKYFYVFFLSLTIPQIHIAFGVCSSASEPVSS